MEDAAGASWQINATLSVAAAASTTCDAKLKGIYNHGVEAVIRNPKINSLSAMVGDLPAKGFRSSVYLESVLAEWLQSGKSEGGLYLPRILFIVVIDYCLSIPPRIEAMGRQHSHHRAKFQA